MKLTIGSQFLKITKQIYLSNTKSQLSSSASMIQLIYKTEEHYRAVLPAITMKKKRIIDSTIANNLQHAHII